MRVRWGNLARPFRAGVSVSVGAALLEFAFLLPRVARDVALTGDSAELVTAASDLGVPHAPGFPAFVFAGHVFALLPAVSVPFGLNLMSAVAHAVTVGLVVATCRRLGASAIACATAGIALGLSGSFVDASLYAEVFPLAHALFAGLLFVAFREPRPQGVARVSLVAALAAVAVATHPMVALGFPALGVILWPTDRQTATQRYRWMLASGASFVAPLLCLYACLVPVAARHPAVSWGNVHDLRSVLRLFLRSDYGGAFHASRHAADAPFLPRLVTWASLVESSTGLLVLALGAAGLAYATRTRPRVGLALLLAFVSTGPLFALLDGLFGLADEDHVALVTRFVTMALVPLAVAVGLAADAGQRMLEERRLPGFVTWAIPLVVAATLAPRALAHDRSSSRVGRAFVDDLFRDTPDDALVALSGDVYGEAALFACGVEHRCGRRIVLQPGLFFLDWQRAELERRYPELGSLDDVRTVQRAHVLFERMLPHRPVYVQPHILGRDPEIEARFGLEPHLLLFRLVTRGDTESGTLTFKRFANDVARGTACEGCSLRRADVPPPSMEVGVLRDYRNALTNMAHHAASLGWQPLAGDLGARAAEIDVP